MQRSVRRRDFNRGLIATAGAAAIAGMPRLHACGRELPRVTHGVMSGEITHQSAVLWSRCDRAARMMVELSAGDAFTKAHRIEGPRADESSDFTARVLLDELPRTERVFYRLWFEDRDGLAGPPESGSFPTVAAANKDVNFAWSGDTAGQGFGINIEWGGMKIYDAIRRLQPQFFVHCGDLIYADNPIEPEIVLRDGSKWKNVVTKAKDHAAVTLDDFRGNYAYNLMDEHLRRFHAEIPQYVLWDDHETTNNWYPDQELALRRDRKAYEAVRFGRELAARAQQAFFDYAPFSDAQRSRQRLYRAIHRGPLLDLFLLDLRSYRGPNSANLQRDAGPESAMLGAYQLTWLKRQLKSSKATWKVICSDMPIGLVIGDAMEGKPHFEGVANADGGPPLGREHEFSDLLQWIKVAQIQNVLWLTADVHYAAAHHYAPERSALPGKFNPFWEFVAGPLHAGTFGPNPLDGTFGPEVKYQWAPPKGVPQPLPPSAGMQSFGTIRIDAKSKRLTVTLRDLAGRGLPGGEFELEAA